MKKYVRNVLRYGRYVFYFGPGPLVYFMIGLLALLGAVLIMITLLFAIIGIEEYLIVPGELFVLIPALIVLLPIAGTGIMVGGLWYSDLHLRYSTAQDPETPPENLTLLSKEGNMYIRGEIASNRSTPVAIIAELTKDKKPWVRSRAAYNPSTTFKIFAELALDEDIKVRGAVAKSPYTPIEIRQKLLEDENDVVHGDAVSGFKNLL